MNHIKRQKLSNWIKSKTLLYATGGMRCGALFKHKWTNKLKVER